MQRATRAPESVESSDSNLAAKVLARLRRGESGASKRRAGEAIFFAVALALLYALWAGNDNYRLALMVLGIAYALLGLGIYVPLVLGARLSVCYNAYFAAGAYAVGLIAARTNLPIIIAIPIGVGAAIAIAALVSLVCRGLSGYHLAVATIAVANVADRVLIDQGAITGGSSGIGNIPSIVVFGVSMGTQQLVIAGLILVWLATVAVNRLRDSVWGFALRLQRDAPVAVEACGASVESLRMVAVCLGAAIASLAGLLLAYVNHFIIPESFAFVIVFTVIFIPIVGGSGSAWGSVVGAAFVLWLTNSFSVGNASGALIFGVGTVLILIIAPSGFLGIIYAAWDHMRRRVGRRGAEVRING
jgi:branched-chain amino acid transport system permease protein